MSAARILSLVAGVLAALGLVGVARTPHVGPLPWIAAVVALAAGVVGALPGTRRPVLLGLVWGWAVLALASTLAVLFTGGDRPTLLLAVAVDVVTLVGVLAVGSRIPPGPASTPRLPTLD